MAKLPWVYVPPPPPPLFIYPLCVSDDSITIQLARDWETTIEEANETLARWYSDRPEVLQWQKETIERARFIILFYVYSIFVFLCFVFSHLVAVRNNDS
jgi:hypothetical protein